MKYLLIILGLSLFPLFTKAQNTLSDKPNPAKKILLVEASCGQCQLGLLGNDCSLAVRINGKAYFVEGAHIDAFGDAHAKDGFCQAIKKAEVQGEIVGKQFKLSYFKLQEKTSEEKPKE